MENVSNWILICAFLAGVLLILLIIGTTVCLGKSFGLCKKIRGRAVSPAYQRNHLSLSLVENEQDQVVANANGNGHGRGGRLFGRYKRPKFARKVNRNQIYWLTNNCDDQEPIATICQSSGGGRGGEYQTPTTTNNQQQQDMLMTTTNGDNHVPVKKLLNFDKTSLNSAINNSPSTISNMTSRLDDVLIKQKKATGGFGSNRWSFHSFHSGSLGSSLTPIKGARDRADQLLLDDQEENDDDDSYDQCVSQATLTGVNGSLPSVNFQKVKDAIDHIITENIDLTPVNPNDRDSLLNLNYPYAFNSRQQADAANISVSDAFLKALSDNRVQVSRDSRKKSIFSQVEIDNELVNF